ISNVGFGGAYVAVATPPEPASDVHRGNVPSSPSYAHTSISKLEPRWTRGSAENSSGNTLLSSRTMDPGHMPSKPSHDASFETGGRKWSRSGPSFHTVII